MKIRGVVLGYSNFILGLSLLAFGALAHAGSGQLLPNPNPNASQNYYGNAVALTPDGSIAVIAANNGGYGFYVPSSVNIFQYANNAWGATPIITICDPAANTTCTSDSAPTDLFGSAVSVSSISNSSFVLIVGSPGGGIVLGSPVSYGVVYIYQCTISPASCGLPVAVLSDPVTSPSASDNFGSAVAISPDGNTVLVGAWGTVEPGGSGVTGDQPNEGSAYIYTNAGNNNWLKALNLLDPTPTCGTFVVIVCDEFGYAVALSGSGSSTMVLIGAPGAAESNSGSLEPGEGQAFIFSNVGTLLNTITNANPAACNGIDYPKCDEFGLAVALSADGGTALVGAPNADAGSVFGEYGLVSLYHQSIPGSWSGVTSPVITYSNPNQNPNDNYASVGGFGSSLVLSNDGTTVLVGLPEGAEGTNSGGYGGSGEMDSYTCNFSSSPPCVNTPAQTYVDPVVLLDPNKSPEPADYFGGAVAISSDASVLLAGAPDSNLYGAYDNGAAYAYGAPSTTNTQVALTFTFTGPNNIDVAAGQNLVYSLIVTNTDKSVSATNVTLTGTLAAGLTLVSYSTDNGSCNTNGSNYSCTISSLGPGASWIPTLTVQISSADAGQTVVVASASVKADNSSNNPAITASVTVSNSTTNLSMYYEPFWTGWAEDADRYLQQCTGTNANNCTYPSSVVCTNAPGSGCLMIIVIFNNSKTVTANNVALSVTFPPGTSISNVNATVSQPGVCLVDPSQNTMGCGLGSLPYGEWAISFDLIVSSTAQIGKLETSQATVTTSNAGSTNASYNVGTPYTVNGANGGIGWLELITLGGLLWVGWRRLAKKSA